MKTLFDVQTGDEVVLNYDGHLTAHKVERTTNTQIILSVDRRYWKKSGKLVGYANSYRIPSIQVMDDRNWERLIEQEAQAQKNLLARRIREADWRDLQRLTVAQLTKACEILGLKGEETDVTTS
jgi:hypothetical protein